MKKDKNDLLIPSGLLIGLGVGLIIGQVAGALLIGLGVGFFMSYFGSRCKK